MITMSLRDNNYDVTEGECPDCEEGNLWVNSYELVCEQCDTVFRKATNEATASASQQENYDEVQKDSTYDNSGKIILPGGFIHAYRGDGLYGNPDE